MGVDLRNFLKKLDKDCLRALRPPGRGSMEDVPAPLRARTEETDKEDFIYNPAAHKRCAAGYG